MQKVRMKKSYGDYENGEIYEVSNNEAHHLIDAGWAELLVQEVKEFKPEPKEGYACQYCGRIFESKRGLSVHKNYCKEKDMRPDNISSYETK